MGDYPAELVGSCFLTNDSVLLEKLTDLGIWILASGLKAALAAYERGGKEELEETQVLDAIFRESA